MSIFKVNVVARNLKREEMATPPVEALVDTGSELTWLPAEVLKSVGITPRRKRMFATATQQKVEREVGFAIRTAVRKYREERRREGMPFNDLLKQTSGIWKAGDGLSYQRRLRKEWK